MRSQPSHAVHRRPLGWAVALLLLLTSCTTQPWHQSLPTNWKGTHALLAPPPPAPLPDGAINPDSLSGKVMAGYQGWAVAEGDGSEIGWTHYGVNSSQRSARVTRRFSPGSAVIDMWPDLTEAGLGERYPTEFRFADGSVAEVTTARHPDTIDRHFRWMEEYGIDGVFLQRFVTTLSQMPQAAMRNAVFRGVRTGAARHGRTWALMYDLSGSRSGTIEKAVMDDWRRMVDLGRIRDDPRLQRHAGKPVVALWGVGFKDGRQYTLAECERLIRWLKDDPVYGGNTVVLGVPYRWREQTNDAVADPELLRVLALADVLSPWAVGRLKTPEDARRTSETMVTADLAWTGSRGLSYLPVIYPGFSWHNLQRSRGNEAAFDAIPRQRGEFFRSLAAGTLAGGATMLYVAMFDEIDEGTAVMKTSQNPPGGESPFLHEEGVPSDYYLRLTGEIRQWLRTSTANR
ncbi:MAG: glycoside hydrolase family 71/99-like protein [Lacunisphaera sp.]|nr:glycoside hydrolase family 71/99-like protein [Lacunisphaera sp.]